MAAPLRSANPGEQKSMQFAHFGVLNAGTQSKTSTLTSLILNLTIAFVVIVISMASAKSTIERNKLLTNLVVPITQKKLEPVKPRITPSKLKLPEIAKIEPPRITIPQVKLPELPIVKMDQPKPFIAQPAPLKIIARAAPVAVNMGHPQAASVLNNDAHPSPVRLGNSTSPLNHLTGPSVASVNLAAGMPGMNSANRGNGPRTTVVNFGNGSPESTSMKGRGPIAVAGIPHGVPGATGKAAGGQQQVNLGQVTPPPMPKAPSSALASSVQRNAPKVLYKPKPDYTAEAKQLHVEGIVTIHIRVLPNGSVQIVAVTSGLGHGLDESAQRAILATRFEPATDAAGNPITWDGIVKVAFQLAG